MSSSAPWQTPDERPQASPSRRPRRGRFLPPLLILLGCLPLIAYRTTASDWYWWSHRQPSPATPPLARVDLPTTDSVPPAEDDAVEAAEPAESPTNEAAAAARDEPIVVVNPTPPEDEEEAIRLAAEQAKGERERLERFKQEEDDRLASRPPVAPRPTFRGLDAAGFERMRKQMETVQAEHLRQFAAMARFQDEAIRRHMSDFEQFARGQNRRPAAPQGFGEANHALDRFLEESLRRQREFLRPFNDPEDEELPLPPPPAPARRQIDERRPKATSSRTITLRGADGRSIHIVVRGMFAAATP